MGKVGRKWAKRIVFIFVLLVVAGFAINWFMTYRLEDHLRKRLRSEIFEVTDGLYHFSFEGLQVGLFDGELVMWGLALYPDSLRLDSLKTANSLPETYLDLHIDTIDFKGINLTWLFNYRQLSFDQFLVRGPTIKAFSQPELMKKKSTSQVSKTLHEIVSPYFDVIQASTIDLERASIEYTVTDSTVSVYGLKDFGFNAHSFILDKYSEEAGKLLYSEYFEFIANTPQVVFDSDHLLLNIDQIKLSTQDSIAQVTGIHLEPKDAFWKERLTIPGSYVNVKVGGLLLDGIAFTRRNGRNQLDARTLDIRYPDIEYFTAEGDNVEMNAEIASDTLNISAWSLYSIMSPIFEHVAINNIDVERARFQYSQTKQGHTDIYTLRSLDFFAQDFRVDSMSHLYNFFLYVKEFSVDAANVTGHIPSKNADATMSHFRLSTIDKLFQVTELKLEPISMDTHKDYLYGSVDGIEIAGLNYQTGVDADYLKIESPKFHFIKSQRKEPLHKENTSIKDANNLLDVIAPFVSHLSVKNISVSDGEATFIDKRDSNTYRLSNLDFYAKNFYIDKETRYLRDYLFKWDEYKLSFKDFDNLTPDKKYRLQIADGNFSSISGDMLLKGLKFTPTYTSVGSYVSITSPLANLKGFKENDIKKQKLSFRSFELQSPVVEVIDDSRHSPTKTKEQVRTVALQIINFDFLSITAPSVFYLDKDEGSSMQFVSNKLYVDSFRWDMNKKLSIHNLLLDSPSISLIRGAKVPDISNEKDTKPSSWGDIDINQLKITTPSLKVKGEKTNLDFSAKNILLNSASMRHEDGAILKVNDFDLDSPTINYVTKQSGNKISEPITNRTINKQLTSYFSETHIGRFHISNMNMDYTNRSNHDIINNKLNNTSFLIENLQAVRNKRTLSVDELAFKTYNLKFPIMDSFYTLSFDTVDFSKKRQELQIKGVELRSTFPKFDFAYMHPKGKDWFNVQLRNLDLQELDLSRLITDSMVLVGKISVDDVLLENFKNQKIEIEHNIMPLLYEEFQKLPIKYYVADLNIKRFSVIYEELAKNGAIPARLPFTNMNGHVKGFTNIAQNNTQFYTLHADGLVMGVSPFVAEWKMPIEASNDLFFLNAEIRHLDMREFNQLVRPMAPAYVRSGYIDRLSFNTEATSLGATVDMQFQYDSLYVVLLKDIHSSEHRAYLTRLINRWGIEERNMGKNMRNPHSVIVRDPYHSNFNYFWQILQPPLIESVGISQEKQNIVKNTGDLFSRIKAFFRRSPKEEPRHVPNSKN